MDSVTALPSISKARLFNLEMSLLRAVSSSEILVLISVTALSIFVPKAEILVMRSSNPVTAVVRAFSSSETALVRAETSVVKSVSIRVALSSISFSRP